MPLYQLNATTRRFNTRTGEPLTALAGLSLTISKGERLALIGPSGAGKSTLFRLLNGTLRPSGGEVRFVGRSLEACGDACLKEMRRRIGTVYQAQHLVPTLSVLQNVLAGRLGSWPWWKVLASRIRPAREDVEQALSKLRRVDVLEKADAPTHTLSGGQQQRVAIARVLMQDPQVILADEPISALDPNLSNEIIELLVGLQEGGRTLICSLHSVQLALRHFPRIVALKEGRLFFDLPSAEVSPALLETLFANQVPEDPGGVARVPLVAKPVL